jgi:hypothetical protein
MPGRVMKEYIVISKKTYQNSGEFAELLKTSLEYVHSLPPKEKKKKKRR